MPIKVRRYVALVLIALATLAIIRQTKKIPEPLLIVGAGLLGLVLFRA